MKIAVVGAGISGSSAYRVLEEMHHEVTLYSGGKLNSLAALAAMRSAYHKDEESRAFTLTLGIYRSWGIAMEQGAWVTSYRHANTKWDDDWYVINPAAPLVTVDNPGYVDPEDLLGEYERVILASGGDGVHTKGITWVNQDPMALAGGETRVHHIAPYKSIVAAQVGDVARLGSSSSKDPFRALEQAKQMLQLAKDVGIVCKDGGWEPIYGTRIKQKPYIRRLGNRLWGFGGFHRTGYALAPAYAHQLAQQL